MAASTRKAPAGDAATTVAVSHPERVVFPASKLTKGDVVAFYDAVADRLLPHLRDRPITVERYPEGVSEKAPRFWQKNTPAYYPKWIPRVTLPTDDGKPVAYALVNDRRSLLYLANQNALTFHVWMSRVRAGGRTAARGGKEPGDVPDFVLFDIDPHQSTFANALTVAKTLHEILDDMGVENFVKTSGKSGLHVMTPWPARPAKRGDGFDVSRAWAETIARRVAGELPKIATIERTISKRGSRVYVDAMQNARGKHAVPPYVLRATAEGTVSMPLEWRELTPKLSPRQFDLRTALKRILRQKPDPLAALTGK